MDRFFKEMQGIRLILVFALVALCVAACDNKEAISAAQKELEELNARYQELKAEEQALSKERSERARLIRGGSSSFDRRLERAEEDLKASQEYIDLLGEENARLEKLLAEWKVAVRGALAGRKFDRIVTKSGKELVDVVVKSVDDEMLEYTRTGRAGSALRQVDCRPGG